MAQAVHMFNGLVESVTQKLQGTKYHHNLLGESLGDLMRKATSKTLVSPDEDTNQLVVDTIQQEHSAGKSSSEIANLLKKRLQMDNPHKQWLAVILVGKVMQSCPAELSAHQEELLIEVAKVMAHPNKPETDAAKQARSAAKEVLRHYGRGGAAAYRNANQQYRQQGGGGRPGLGGDYGGGGGGGGAAGGVAVQQQQIDPAVAAAERDSVIDEVQRLVEQSKVNTELLGEMLMNAAGTADDFEQELVRDLVAEVRELRSLLGAYLEQLGNMEDPVAEALMCQALEAVDMLDGALELQADVGQNLAEADTHPSLVNHQAPTSPTGGASGGASGSASADAVAAPPAPPPQVMDDLIGFDDMNDGAAVPVSSSYGGVQMGAPSAAYDPFAASSTFYPPMGGAPPPPVPYYQQQQQQQQPGPPAAAVPKSAFEEMFVQGHATQDTYNNLSSAAAPPPVYPGQQPPPYGAPPPVVQNNFQPPPPQQQQQQQQQQQAPPSYAQAPPPAAYQQPPPPVYTAAPPAAVAQSYVQPPPQQQDFAPSTFPAPSSGSASGFGDDSAFPQQFTDEPAFGAGSPPAAPYSQTPSQRFGSPPPQQQQQQQALPPQQQQQQQQQFAPTPANAAYSAPPYAAPPPAQGAQPGSFNAATNPFGGATAAAPSNNPFGGAAPTAEAAAPAPAPASNAGASSIDAQWDMFFADRAAGAPQ